MPQAALQTEWSGMFTKGQWHYIRASFGMAGQDSFTQAPSQSEDLFSILTNILPPLQGNLQRRWGYSLVNNSISTQPVNTGVGGIPVTVPGLYYNFDTNSRKLIFPITANSQPSQAVLNEDGTVWNANIGISGTDNSATQRFVSSRSFAYFSNGRVGSQFKWNGSSTNTQLSQTKWGIDINQVVGASGSGGPVGPMTPAVGASNSCVSTIHILFGKPNPGDFTETDTPCGFSSNQFGFAMPGSPDISGITIRFSANDSLNGAMITAQLTKAGVPYGVSKSINVGSTPNTYVLGSATDLWGGVWLPGDINDPGFGVVWSNQNQVLPNITGPGSYNSTDTIQVNSVEAIVNNGTAGPNSLFLGAPLPGGAITLVSGRTYFAIFENSTTPHFSDLSQPSISTGPLTLQSQPIAGIPVSTDVQVDTVILLATADGGDETLLYELVKLPNGTTTYTDNIPDTQLVLNNVYLETDAFGNEIGVADNDPPPTDLLFPLAHRGRIYGANSQNLFYSKAESDLLTTTGLLAGKFEEAWPGLNYFTISSNADVITGLLSDGQVLYVGTTTRVFRLFGDGPNNYTIPEVLFTDVGVLNQDVWKMVFVEGNPLGAMWLTPDYRVMGSDFNTYQDVGRPVQDVLNSINTAVAVNVSWSSYIAQGIYAVWVLAIPTQNNLFPDKLLVFDLKMRQWFVWELTDTPIGGVFDIIQNGLPKFFFQNPAGSIYSFDPKLAQDKVGETPSNFPVTIQTSWLSLVDITARKYLNEIEIATEDPGLLVTVEGASTAAHFLSPNPVVTFAPLVVKPRGEFATFLSTYPAKDRYYRYTFTSNSQVQDLLRTMSIEGGILHRV